MTTFIAICAGLVLFSGMFYLFPPKRSGSTEADLERANLEWFRRRRAELREEGYEDLEEDARLRLLEDERGRGAVQRTLHQSFPAWVLLPLVALGAAALYLQLGAASDVEIAQRLRTMQEGLSDDQMRQLIQDVEKRSADRPDNLHYLALLGRYYMSQEEFARAQATYDQLTRAVPEDAQMLAYAAQAEYLAGGRTLTQQVRLRAEQSLAVDPHQPTALGLLGMALYEEQQYADAIVYWQRLLALEPPGSESAALIGDVLANARQHLAQSGAVAAAAGIATAQASNGDASLVDVSAGVTVRVSAPAEADIAAGDTVFILARSAGSGSRMPIAVQRLTGAELPATVRLDDRNSMAGQKMSQTPSVMVAVQVSADGRPGEENARWLGQADGIVPSLDEDPVEIVLHPKNP